MSEYYGRITAPVSIDDVASALGVGVYDLGTLCTSDRINKWSRHKPVSINQVQEVTDEQLAAINYGWNIPSYNTMKAAWNAYVAGTGWDYIRPSSYFRLTDFNGYNHQQESPLEATLQNTTVSVGGTIGISCIGIEDIMTWGAFAGYAPYYTGIQIGIMCSNGYYYPLTGPQGQTILEIDFEKLNAVATSGVFSAGNTYTFCPVLTTWTGNGSVRTWTYINQDDMTGTWWLLPTNTLQVSIISSGTGGGGGGTNPPVSDSLDLTAETVSMTYTEGSTYSYSNISFNLNMTLGSGYSGTVPSYINADIYVKDAWTSNGTQDVLIGTARWDSPTKGGSYSATLSYSGTIEKLSSKDEVLACIAIVTSSNGDTATYTFQLEATEIN